MNSHESQGLESICPGSQEEVVLSEVVVSLCVMGLSESYWTAVCFKDEFHEGEPRLEEEDEVEEVDGTTTDPILFEEVSISPPSPRTYYFQALAKFLKMIIKHYKHFAERFGQAIPEPDSLSTQSLRTWMDAAPRTLEMVTGRVIELKDELQTLLKNAAIGSDGLPKAPLLQSLRDDSLAMKSLGTILKVYEDVGRVEKQLQRYGRSCAQLKESVRGSF